MSGAAKESNEDKRRKDGRDVAGLLTVMTLASTAQLVCYFIGMLTPDLVAGVITAEKVAIDKCPLDDNLAFNFTDLLGESLDQNVTFSIGYFAQNVDGNDIDNTAEGLANVLALHLVGLISAFLSVLYTLLVWRKLHFALNRRVKEKSFLKTCLACTCCAWGDDRCCTESDIITFDMLFEKFLEHAKAAKKVKFVGVSSGLAQVAWLLFIKLDCKNVQLSWGEYVLVCGIVLGSVGFFACKSLVRARLQHLFEQGDTNDEASASLRHADVVELEDLTVRGGEA